MKTRKHKSNATESPWVNSALKGCDWFVNTQIIQKRPVWDANHGRFQYNVHIGTGTACPGIGWTQARAVFCLLPAYQLTGDDKYLDAARHGIGYIKTLQNMDRRYPRIYGAFHEETPHSRYAFPRDAIEVADALLQWWKVTGDDDALQRAELFFSWFQKNAVADFPEFGLWVHGDVQFDDNASQFTHPISCEMGCPTILCHAYAATGKAGYKRLATRLADTILAHYVPETGPLSESPTGRMSHHTDKSGIIFNDDGGCVSLFNVYTLTGKQKYLDAAVQNADFYADYTGTIPLYSGIGSIANLLWEAHAVTGKTAYRTAAERYAKQLVKLQVKSGSKRVRGGFRGEDEGAKYYVKGAQNDEMVTTRVTAYSVLTLFKLAGVDSVRGYSVTF